MKFDVTFHRREDGVIPAHTDAFTGPPLGSALSDDNVARDRPLTAEEFHSQTSAG